MRRLLTLACPLVLVLLLTGIGRKPVGADGPDAVHVTNFPAVQTVDGAIRVRSPIPHTSFVVEHAQVSPGSYENPNSYFDGGVIDTAGFTSLTLSLSGEVQGRLGGPAPVGAILIPDVPETLEALLVHGVRQFPIHITTRVAPTPSGLFQAEQVVSRLGFPRYRVYFYNASSRTIDATLYLYLAN